MYVIQPAGLTFDNATNANADAAAWASATNYALGARVSRLGLEYVSAIADNLNFAPENEMQDLEGARWVLAGPVNSQAFLDASPSTLTAGTGPMVVEAVAGSRFTRIALFNTTCRSCVVEVLNSGGAVTGTAEFSIGPEPVDNWLDWHNTIFRSFDRRYIIALSGGAGSKIRVTLEGTDVALGEVYVGRHVKLGDTLLSTKTKVATRTFTAVNTNDFGRSEIVKRATTRDVTYHVGAQADGFENVLGVLEALDGLRVVTYGQEGGHPELINAGLLEAITLPIDMPGHFTFEQTVKGLL